MPSKFRIQVDGQPWQYFEEVIPNIVEDVEPTATVVIEAIGETFTRIGAPTVTALPALIGDATVGSETLLFLGTMSNATSTSNTLLRNGTPVALAAFTPTEADIGVTYVLTLSGNNAGGVPTAVSSVTYGPIASLPAQAVITAIPAQTVTIGSGEVALDLAPFITADPSLILTYAIAGAANVIIDTPEDDPTRFQIVSDTDAMTTAETVTLTLTVTDQFARVTTRTISQTRLGAQSATLTGFVEDRGTFAARQLVPLTGSTVGTPDETIWQSSATADFAAPVAIAGATTLTFTPNIGVNVTDRHFGRFAARFGGAWRYSTAYQFRIPAATLGAALPARVYAAGYPIIPLEAAAAFVVPAGLVPAYSISPAGASLATGASINALTGVITGTPTAVGARALLIRITDQYGFALDAALSMTVNTITAAIVGTSPNQRVVVTVGADTDPAIPITSIAITGGAWAGTITTDVIGGPLTVGTFQTLGVGAAVPLVAPVIALTTDSPPGGILNLNDVAELTVPTLFARGEGDTITTTLAWRDADGALDDTDASYTGLGDEVNEVFIIETGGGRSAVSNVIPTATVAVKSATAVGTFFTSEGSDISGMFTGATGITTGDDLLIAVFMRNNISASRFNSMTIDGVNVPKVAELPATTANPEIALFRIPAPASLANVQTVRGGATTAMAAQAFVLEHCGPVLGITGGEGSVLSIDGTASVTAGDLIIGAAMHTGAEQVITLNGLTTTAQALVSDAHFAVGSHVCETTETRALSASVTPGARNISAIFVRF